MVAHCILRWSTSTAGIAINRKSSVRPEGRGVQDPAATIWFRMALNGDHRGVMHLVTSKNLARVALRDLASAPSQHILAVLRKAKSFLHLTIPTYGGRLNTLPSLVSHEDVSIVLRRRLRLENDLDGVEEWPRRRLVDPLDNFLEWSSHCLFPDMVREGLLTQKGCDQLVAYTTHLRIL
jgi:hypothetical protein